MTGIDWGKAPKGFPIWIEPTAGGAGGWHRDDGDRYTNETNTFWKKPEEGDYTVHTRPTWVDQSVPPIGSICEAWYDDGRVCWHEAEVICHHPVDPGVVAVRLMTARQSNRLAWVDTLRPIQTEEQIAAEKRQAAISDLAEFLSSKSECPTPYIWELAQKTYDYGFRKQEVQ